MVHPFSETTERPWLSWCHCGRGGRSPPVPEESRATWLHPEGQVPGRDSPGSVQHGVWCLVPKGQGLEEQLGPCPLPGGLVTPERHPARLTPELLCSQGETSTGWLWMPTGGPSGHLGSPAGPLTLLPPKVSGPGQPACTTSALRPLRHSQVNILQTSLSPEKHSTHSASLSKGLR